MEWILVLACIALAYTNGANDNFKAVATLFGSAQLSYRAAIGLATASQLVGSLFSLVIAGALVKAFSGKGLVPPEMFSTAMLASVALGAASTVEQAIMAHAAEADPARAAFEALSSEERGLVLSFLESL